MMTTKPKHTSPIAGAAAATAAHMLAVATLTATLAFGQAFSSGSNGSDGAYRPTASGDFDPAALNIDRDSDNIFHFTTLEIPAGVTIRLRASKMRRTGPVYFLATGAVNIEGTLDLRGQDGHPVTAVLNDRYLSEPGAGGYPGGMGILPGMPNTGRRGYGPGSLATPSGALCVATHAASNLCQRAYGNPYLVPLIGGSGGEGYFKTTGGAAAIGGGAGGGAIRIASSVSLRVAGAILANGGASVPPQGSGVDAGSPGSGGAIHLQAPSLTLVSGYRLEVLPGAGGTSIGSPGRVRVEASSVSGGVALPVPLSPLAQAPLPTSFPTLRIVTVNGQPVPPQPLGSSATADVQITAAQNVPIQIAATGLPTGTQVQALVFTDGVTNANDLVPTPVPLAGSLSSSTATITANLTQGFYRILVFAKW